MTAVVAEPAGRVTDKNTGERFYPYPLTQEQLDSVTTVIGATESKPWLRDWYATSALGWAADNLDLFVATLAAEGRKVAIDLGKGAAEQSRDISRDAGVYVHDVQEALILWAASPGRTGTDIALPVLPGHLAEAWYGDDLLVDVIDFMVDGFISFVSQFNPAFEATEMQVYNQPLGIAGTLDMIIVLTGYAVAPSGDRLIACPGSVVVVCVDTKTGKSPEGTWKEQLAAYRRMTECLLPLGQLHPMPATDCGAVLHLRPEYPDGYLLMIVAGRDDEAAWQRFQKAASIYRERQKVKGKPGKSVRALRPDGTMPGPRLCDLASEGYGRALSPLSKALGSDCELEHLASFTAEDVLAVRGVGKVLIETIRQMLADHGLTLADEAVSDHAAA
jgi:hypothetical protein